MINLPSATKEQQKTNITRKFPRFASRGVLAENRLPIIEISIHRRLIYLRSSLRAVFSQPSLPLLPFPPQTIDIYPRPSAPGRIRAYRPRRLPGALHVVLCLTAAPARQNDDGQIHRCGRKGTRVARKCL